MGDGAHVFMHQQPPFAVEAFDAVPIELLGSPGLGPGELDVVGKVLGPDVEGWARAPASSPEGDQQQAEGGAGQEPAEGC